MDLFSYDILWLLLLLFTINFIGIALIRSDERFWLPSTLLWVLLVCTMFINMTLNKNNVVDKEIVYNAQTEPESKSNETAIAELDKAKQQQQSETITLLRLTGFQAFLCFLCQLLGYKLTSKNQFRKGAIAFFVFVMVYGAIEVGRMV
jgi:hypothetical protein